MSAGANIGRLGQYSNTAILEDLQLAIIGILQLAKVVLWT
jgi:hypothetical protein